MVHGRPGQNGGVLMDRFPVLMPRPLRLSAALLIASVVVGCEVAPAPIPTAEREALVALYNSTDGDDWADNTGWLLSADPCGWFGVICSGGQVWRVDLNANNLTGSIPAELGNLTALLSLSLRSNNLTGSIPPELGNLTALSGLSLHFNDLSGPIPAELGNLTALVSFRLDGNQLSGPIPAELGNLTALASLSVAGNQLSGPIPAALGNLAALVSLHLESNQLSDPLPAELGNLTALNQLFLHSNNLTGSIPAELGNLTALTSFWLYSNGLSGLVPLSAASLGGELQQIAPDRCMFESNPGLFMPDSQDYMDADLGNDGFICGIGLSTPSL
jgi:Leucine-rich repeat (LRR) protein